MFIGIGLKMEKRDKQSTITCIVVFEFLESTQGGRQKLSSQLQKPPGVLQR